MKTEELNNSNVDLGIELTINRAEEIKEILLKEFNEKQSLKINNNSAHCVDITYLQLLIACRKFTNNASKIFKLDNNDEQTLSLIKEAGISLKYFSE